MDHYSKEELEEALRSIASTLGKSEKSKLKLKEGTSQHITISKEIKAYKIALDLIDDESVHDRKGNFESKHTNEELVEALQSISSTNSKVEKILPKFNPGTSQHTLAVRRIKAFNIATKLMKRQLK